MNNQERAEKAIRRWMPQAPDVWDECAREAVKELDNAGLLMPDLPEPYSQDESSTSWLLNGDVGVKVNPRCAVIIEHVDVGWFALPPEDARAYALALLAAADHAEQGEGNA